MVKSLLLILLLLSLVASKSSQDGCFLLCDTVLALLVAALGTVDETTLALGVGVANATLPLLEGKVRWLLLLCWDVLWVLADCLVDSEVQVLEAISLDIILNILGEFLLILLWLLLFESLHVASDMATEDALAMSLSIVLLLLSIEAVELLVGVRDLEAAIEGTLEGSEQLGAQGGGLEADIHESVEGRLTILVLRAQRRVRSNSLLLLRTSTSSLWMYQSSNSPSTSSVPGKAWSSPYFWRRRRAQSRPVQ